MVAIPSLYVPAAGLPQSNATSWLDQLNKSGGDLIDQASKNKSFGKLADIIQNQQQPQVQQNSGGFLSGLIPSKQPTATSSAPVGNTSPGQPNQIYNDFIGTVQKGGLTNPYGLAAVAATGRAESGYDPGKLNASWPDPSQSGQPGTSGGLLSWRNERLANLRNYAQSQGVDPNNIPASVQGQFFLQENPQLVQQLNSAKTPQEAAALMANAWKFAGYDQQGGEAARRAALAQNYYATQFANQQPQPTQVASLDPSAGMTTAYRDPQVSAPNSAAAAINAVAPQTPAIDPATATPDQMLAALGPTGGATPSPQASPAGVAAPQQVAQAAPQTPSNGILAAGIAPANRQNISNQQLADLVRDPNTRQVGLALWQQVATGKAAEPWQFVQLGDGTLARANATTGEIQAVGRFNKPQGLENVTKGAALYDPNTQQWITPPPGAAGAAGPSDLGLNPQYGVDEQGNPVLLQLSKDGQTVKSTLPNGVKLSKEPIKLDAGSSWVLLDPITRQPVGTVPKDVSGEANAKAVGTAQGQAQAALPQVEEAANQMLASIDSLSSDPYLPNMLGKRSSLPNFSTESQRVQSKMDQINGQSFLQAYNTLRGGGQITEVEGQKASAAMARLNVAQNEHDYREALGELRQIVVNGIARAKQKAGLSVEAPATPSQPSTQGTTSSGIQWSVEP